MAIVTGQAKLYVGVRSWCVDKNISANLSAAFTVGNKDIDFPTDVPVKDSQGNDVIYPGIYFWRLRRAVSDMLCPRPQPVLANERYKTYGGGNNVITPEGVDNTNNWKVNSTLTCQFPTYIEIDVEKLQLPEATTVTLHFEEGWLYEDRGHKLTSGAWEYPNAVQDSPSPEAGNYVTFRTPWYGVAKLNSVFNRNIIPLRIKQLAANFPQALGAVTFRIRYSPGRFASLFVNNFTSNATSNAVFRPVLTLFSFTGGGSQQWNNFTFRTRFFESNFGTVTFTQPNTPGVRVRFADCQMASSFTMNTSAVKEARINLTAFTNGAMNTVAVKTTDILSNNTMSAGVVAGPARRRDTFSTIQSQSSLSGRGIYNTGALKANIVATTSLEQSFDFVLEIDTNNVVPVPTYNYIVDRSVLLYLYGFNGTVFWGDGTSNNYNSTAQDNGNAFHTYAVDGVYTIRIRGTLDHFGMVYKDRDPDTTAYTDRPRYDRYLGYLQSVGNNKFGGYRFAFTKVKAWGDTGLNNLERALYGMENLTSIPGDFLNPITNLKETFMGCSALQFPDDIGYWNVSAITSLERTFNGCSQFNKNINTWNISNVTSLNATFTNCQSFNQPLNSWNTSNVTDLTSTFSGCYAFNQNIDNWNTSKVTSLVATFANARAFNQPLNSWNTSKVIAFATNGFPSTGTFTGAWAFNQPLSNWVVNAPGEPNPINGIRLWGMFMDARSFNQNINSWNVTRSTYMISMFEGALAFNQPLSNWDMSGVLSIDSMFKGATSFNQDIGMWRTTSIAGNNTTSLSSVFDGATSFNQDLSKWCVVTQTTLPYNFYNNTPAWNKTNRVPVWGTCPPYP